MEIFKVELEADLNESSLFKMQKKWSSLYSVIIINEIELRTSIVLTVDDILQSETIKDLYDRVKNHMAINE